MIASVQAVWGAMDLRFAAEEGDWDEEEPLDVVVRKEVKDDDEVEVGRCGEWL